MVDNARCNNYLANLLSNKEKCAKSLLTVSKLILLSCSDSTGSK